MFLLETITLIGILMHMQKPGVAEAEFARLDLNHLFKMVFGMRKPATIILPQDKTFFDAIDSDGTCPPWLSEEDISYYADKFGKTGFTGGFNYYRCIDLYVSLSWFPVHCFVHAVHRQPNVLFLQGLGADCTMDWGSDKCSDKIHRR
jgi:hypothetical protein